MNITGFDRENWLTIGTRHARDACSLVGLHTKSDLKKTESELGCRYSVLFKLPYLMRPECLLLIPCTIFFWDQLSSYFLKSIFVSHNVINESDFAVIQDYVDSILAPSNIGRIPHKISSGCSSFTADQWKNWTIYYSLIALRGLLSTDILEFGRLFVFTCRVLCSKR